MPDFPRQLLAGARDGIEDLDERLRLRERGWLSPQGSSVAAKALNAFAAQSWYYCQLFRLAEGRPADISRSVLSTMREYLVAESKSAYATRRVYPREWRAGVG